MMLAVAAAIVVIVIVTTWAWVRRWTDWVKRAVCAVGWAEIQWIQGAKIAASLNYSGVETGVIGAIISLDRLINIC